MPIIGNLTFSVTLSFKVLALTPTATTETTTPALPLPIVIVICSCVSVDVCAITANSTDCLLACISQLSNQSVARWPHMHQYLNSI